MSCLYKRQDKWDRAGAEGKAPTYERIIMLMQIGTSGGPCALICAVFLFCAVYLLGRKADIALGIGAMTLGAALVILGWLKAAGAEARRPRINVNTDAMSRHIPTAPSRSLVSLRATAHSARPNSMLSSTLQITNSNSPAILCVTAHPPHLRRHP
jgi:hypothetical protein